jgi:ElaA protein
VQTIVADARPAELDAVTMYRILRLRVDVFVVEQRCPYPELDGRDLEPGARWVWATAEGSQDVLGTLRILSDGDRDDDADRDADRDGAARIGRVATARAARSAGIAGGLMEHALGLLGDQIRITLDAQSPLVGWYERFGFVASGPEFVEDGIGHRPMTRAPRPALIPPHNYLDETV